MNEQNQPLGQLARGTWARTEKRTVNEPTGSSANVFSSADREYQDWVKRLSDQQEASKRAVDDHTRLTAAYRALRNPELHITTTAHIHARTYTGGTVVCEECGALMGQNAPETAHNARHGPKDPEVIP